MEKYISFCPADHLQKYCSADLVATHFCVVFAGMAVWELGSRCCTAHLDATQAGNTVFLIMSHSIEIYVSMGMCAYIFVCICVYIHIVFVHTHGPTCIIYFIMQYQKDVCNKRKKNVMSYFLSVKNKLQSLALKILL